MIFRKGLRLDFVNNLKSLIHISCTVLEVVSGSENENHRIISVFVGPESTKALVNLKNIKIMNFIYFFVDNCQEKT